MTQYNQRSPGMVFEIVSKFSNNFPFSKAVRRILREAKEMKEPTYEYFAQPLEVYLYFLV